MARPQSPWAASGPGRATGGRPTLQTSSNRSSLNPLASAHVTNVVNLPPKTLNFSEKALGLTTFVTTDQKSTRKTPPIDDVCNNTQRSAPKSQHDKPDHTGGPENQAAAPVGGGGAWPGFEATRRAKLAARTTRGRAAAHRHTQRPGPTAPGTPVGPQATPHTHTKRPPGTGWAHLSRLWESNPRPIQSDEYHPEIAR